MINVVCVGAHRFLCCNVTVAGDVTRLLAGANVDMIYCDPPWDQGHLNMFCRLAGKQSVQLETLFECMAKVFNSVCKGHIFVEMGLRNFMQFKKIFEDAGAKSLDVYNIFYGRQPHRNLLWHGSFGAANKLGDCDLSLLRGREIVEWAMLHGSDVSDVVFDPFVGNGMTAVVAHELERICLGMDINCKKVDQAIRKMKWRCRRV